ncbi:MAG: hypothetical protein C4320_01400 [Armatimonadota bacterium]
MRQSGFLNAGDPATLSNGWAKLGLRGPMPTNVQWASERVLVIYLGPRKSGGYSLQVQDIRRDPSGRGKVWVRENTPPPGSIVTQALTSPYLVLIVDRVQVSDFELVWSQGTFGNIPAVPPGSIIYPNGAGYVVMYPPLQYGWEYFDGGYECYGEDPGEIWIDNNNLLGQWGQRYFGDPSYVAPRFDFRSERLLAVHLGRRPAAVKIETVSFKREGREAVLTLREVPVPNARVRSPRTISPFALVRVSREVGRVRVRWAKN